MKSAVRAASSMVVRSVFILPFDPPDPKCGRNEAPIQRTGHGRAPAPSQGSRLSDPEPARARARGGETGRGERRPEGEGADPLRRLGKQRDLLGLLDALG